MDPPLPPSPPSGPPYSTYFSLLKLGEPSPPSPALTKIFPGENVGMGKDHSIFSVVKGKVVFKKSKSDRTFVSVKPN